MSGGEVEDEAWCVATLKGQKLLPATDFALVIAF